MKGASYERTVASLLEPVYPNAQRGIGQSRFGGEVPDVKGTPFWIEAKHRKAPNILAAVLQAIEAKRVSRDAQHAHLPVLAITRRNGHPDLATMQLTDFLALMKELEHYRAIVDKLIDEA